MKKHDREFAAILYGWMSYQETGEDKPTLEQWLEERPRILALQRLKMNTIAGSVMYAYEPR